jgi:hypothetical protein
MDVQVRRKGELDCNRLLSRGFPAGGRATPVTGLNGMAVFTDDCEEIPQLSLVVLIGPSGSGRRRCADSLTDRVLSSDACRGLVSDDGNNQAATSARLLSAHFLAARRLARGC